MRVYDDKISTSLQTKNSNKNADSIVEVTGSDWENRIAAFIDGDFSLFKIPNSKNETVENLRLAKKEKFYVSLVQIKEVFNDISHLFNTFATDIISDRYCTIHKMPLNFDFVLTKVLTIDRITARKQLDKATYLSTAIPFAPSNVIIDGVSTNATSTPKKLLESPFYDQEFSIVASKKFFDFTLRLKKKEHEDRSAYFCDFNCLGKTLCFDVPKDCVRNDAYYNISGYYDTKEKKFVACFLDELNGRNVAYALSNDLFDPISIPISFKPDIPISEKLSSSYDIHLCDGDVRYKVKSYSNIVTSDIVGLVCWYYRINRINSKFKGLLPKEGVSPAFSDFLRDINSEEEFKQIQQSKFPVYEQIVEKYRNRLTSNCGDLYRSIFNAYFDTRFSPPHLIGVRVKHKEAKELRRFRHDQTFQNNISKYFFEYRRTLNKVLYTEPTDVYFKKKYTLESGDVVQACIYSDHLFIHDPNEIKYKKVSNYAHFPRTDHVVLDEMYTDGQLDYGGFMNLLDELNDTNLTYALDVNTKSEIVSKHKAKNIFNHFYATEANQNEKVMLDMDAE